MRYGLKQLLGEGRLWFCNHFVNKLPSHHVRLLFYRRVMNFKIASNSYIHLGCRFNCKGNFTMDEYSTINQNCQIDNRGGISIGKRVSLSPDVKLITADHNLYESNCIGRNKPIIIEDYVFVGYSALILGKSKLSTGSVIGAVGVFKGVTEPYGVYLGNPAVLKNKRPETLNYKMDYNRIFH